jgi:hypothetical protein
MSTQLSTRSTEISPRTGLIVGLVVALLVALGITLAVVLTRLKQKSYPPQPSAPAVSGWYYTGKDMAWATQTFYRYAYVDLVAETQGPWSDASAAVLSFGASMPMIEAVPTGTTVLVWQRKVEQGHWASARMVALKQGAFVTFDSQTSLSQATALTLSERVHSALWIDMDNPGKVPGRPAFAPFPSTVGAQQIDARGLTWAHEGSWPEPTRFACRFVGSEPGPWSAWSESLWVSNSLTDPVVQLPWAEDVAVQLTGSWFNVGPGTSAVHLVFEKENAVRSAVNVTLTPGRTTIDAVLQSIERACFREAGAPVRLGFSLDPGLVTFELLRGEPTPELPAVTNFTMLVNTPDSALRALGFTDDICCGKPGTVYVAGSAPYLALDPVVAEASIVVFV